MQIAQHLAGFTLGGADLLRRAMGKKKAEEMARQQEIFVGGAVARGVTKEQALAIFHEVEGFAAYGFNKSHSAAYAVVTFQTAYLKAHYPTEFFAAILTADKDKIEKVVRTIAEARAWGVSVLPPDVNASETDFTVVYATPAGDGPRRGPGKLRDRFGPRIRFGLGAVRGVGESALETVFEARRAGGPFRDLFDFSSRVDSKRLNRGVLEALVQCGAFDGAVGAVGISRARAFAAVERALERSRSASRDRERGQTTLFGLLDRAPTGGGVRAAPPEDYPVVQEWDRLELLRREKAALGCYVTGHPLFRYGTRLGRVAVTPTLKVASEQPWSVVSVAGMVEGYREKLFRSGGGRVAFFEIEDVVGRVSAKLRGDKIETYSALLTRGDPVVVTGKVSFPVSDDPEDEREPTLLVDGVELVAAAVLKSTRLLVIRLDAQAVQRERLAELGGLLRQAPGGCPVELVLELGEGTEAVLTLGSTLVTPDDMLLAGLERLFGGNVVELA